MLEAEFHAIWIDPSGARLDVSSNGIAASRILFLPDSTRVHDPNESLKRTDNVRYALNNDPDTTEFIRLAEERNSILDTVPFGIVEVAGENATGLGSSKVGRAN